MSFKRVYPQKGKLLFDGGMNTKFERSIIEDNESPDCLNVVFSNGAVSTRGGSQKLNTAAVGSFVFDGLYTRSARDGSQTMIAFAGGHMYALAVTTFVTIPSAQSFFTAGVRVGAVQNENYIFVGNGFVIPHKWNGSEFTRHGVYPPTATSTVASQATGVLTGGYQYKVTAINSALVESDVGPATATFTAASATLRLSSIPTFSVSFGINARRIYRTEAGLSIFKRVATIADNSTTTYDDNTPDTGLGTTAPTDNGVPPLYSIACYHQGRLWVNDLSIPNRAWYSNLGDPYTFASTNFVTVGDNTSDLLRGISVYDNSIILKCDMSDTIVFMSDTDPANWKSLKSKSPYGSKSPFCLIDFDNKQLFPAVQNGKFVGFAASVGDALATTTSTLTNTTSGSDRISDRIEPNMFLVQEAYLGNISGIVFKNKAYITLTYGSGNTTNNRIYVMDFSVSNLRKNQRLSWAPWTGMNAAQFTLYGGKLYYGSSTANGFVYEMETTTYTDDGAAIDSYYWTKEYFGSESEENIYKDFRYANLLIENAGAWFMNITFRTDSDKGTGYTDQINLDPGSSLWGTMVWGVDVWGGGSDQREYRQYLGGARGKRVQLKFSNQNKVNQSFKVHWMKLHYNLKGFR